MARWTPDARTRLERAALELFAAQGFADTTVPQITARAGLTTRTFFRHFADKREVLFGAEAELPALVSRAIADAPASLGPMQVIEQGLGSFAAVAFGGRREALLARRAIIRSDEGLRERELRKRLAVSEAIRTGFADRGVDELTAALGAEIAMAVVSISLTRWLEGDGEQPLTEILPESLAALRALAGE